MWEDFIQPDTLPGLSRGAQEILAVFINRANRQSLHPLDMRRFYGFVRYAHAHRAKMSGATLSKLLREHGFSELKAEQLSTAYDHGRAMLRCPCPTVRDG